MAKIGDIEFNVISESRDYSADVTTHPVESGADITDHVSMRLASYNITGRVGDNENPSSVHARIRSMQRRRELLKYRGRAWMDDCIIEGFNSNVDEKSAKGFHFTMRLTQVKVSKPSTVGLLPVALKVDAADVANAGRVQPQ